MNAEDGFIICITLKINELYEIQPDFAIITILQWRARIQADHLVESPSFQEFPGHRLNHNARETYNLEGCALHQAKGIVVTAIAGLARFATHQEGSANSVFSVCRGWAV